MSSSNQIENNIRVHGRVAASYSRTHGEIYNEVEQGRLHAALERALSLIGSSNGVARSLDFGCGAGNLTDHLIELGSVTVSADVTQEFLDLIDARHRLSGRSTTARLNGEDLREFGSETFDLAATYSVLHHVPDYLAAVREMMRVLKPGGVLFIDHEAPPAAWPPTLEYQRYIQTWRPRRSVARRMMNLLKPSWYVLRARLLVNPRYQPEGDIHVWPDDHIEWEQIERLVVDAGFDILAREDYLLYQRECPRDVYEQYRSRCVDSRLFIARKKS